MTQPIHPMLERVADAIAFEDHDDQSGDYYRRMARAAIHALLEPDEVMVEAATRNGTRAISADTFRLAYQAMLKRLLGDEG